MSWKDLFPKENRFFETKNGILYKGNSEEILKLFKENSIDVILSDPPYKYLNHKLDKDFNEEIIFNAFSKITKKDSFVVLFGRGSAFYRWNVKLNELGFKFVEELIWDKKQPTSPFHTISRIHEAISVNKKGKKKINKVLIDKIEYQLATGDITPLVDDLKKLTSKLNKFETIEELKEFLKGKFTKISSNGYRITANSKKYDKDRTYWAYKAYVDGIKLKSIIRLYREHYTMQHPTQKPLKLIEILLKAFSNKNDIVLDPFIGSGTTAIACENLNRRWIGIEIDDEYSLIAKNRIEEAIKEKGLLNYL